MRGRPQELLEEPVARGCITASGARLRANKLNQAIRYPLHNRRLLRRAQWGAHTRLEVQSIAAPPGSIPFFLCAAPLGYMWQHRATAQTPSPHPLTIGGSRRSPEDRNQSPSYLHEPIPYFMPRWGQKTQPGQILRGLLGMRLGPQPSTLRIGPRFDLP